MFLLFLAAQTITISPPSTSFTIEELVLDNHLCKGYFMPIGGENCTFKIEMIRDPDPLKLFSSDALNYGVESWFHFNLVHSCNINVYFTAIPINNSLPFKMGKIKYQIDIEIDTFNKIVAKNERIDPAIEMIENLQKMTNDIALVSGMVVNDFRIVHDEYRRMLRFMVIVSVLVMLLLGVFMVMNVYQTKRFFKRKKLI